MTSEHNEIADMFRGVISGGKQVNKRMLKDFVRASEDFQAQMGQVKKIRGKMDKGQLQFLKHIQTLADQLTKTDKERMKAIDFLRKQQTKAEARTAKAEEKLEDLITQIDKAEERLQKVITDTERASKYSLDTAAKANQAATRAWSFWPFSSSQKTTHGARPGTQVSVAV